MLPGVGCGRDTAVVSTRLAPERYLDVLRADAARLLEVAQADLDAPVPTCPGWAVRDLVLHVAQVYRHKIACTELQAAPDPWPPAWPYVAADPLGWYAESLDALLALLVERGPAAPSATWYPPEQTVGFWYRRMAHETAIHRVDAESAFGAVTPVVPDLAVDGIDELLAVMFADDWSDATPEQWGGVTPGEAVGTVAVRAGGQVWSVVLRPMEVEVTLGEPEDRPEAAEDAVAASVDGDPSDVLLWAWNRRSAAGIDLIGDAVLLAHFRAWLSLAAD